MTEPSYLNLHAGKHTETVGVFPDDASALERAAELRMSSQPRVLYSVTRHRAEEVSTTALQLAPVITMDRDPDHRGPGASGPWRLHVPGREDRTTYDACEVVRWAREDPFTLIDWYAECWLSIAGAAALIEAGMRADP